MLVFHSIAGVSIYEVVPSSWLYEHLTLYLPERGVPPSYVFSRTMSDSEPNLETVILVAVVPEMSLSTEIV